LKILESQKELSKRIAGVLLILNGLWIWRKQHTPCPLDPNLAKKCSQARKARLFLWSGSLIIYLVGVGWALIGELLL